MFNFGGITHIQFINWKCKAEGKFSLTGSVPVGCYDWVAPSSADVMGGRCKRGDDGKLLAPKARYYESYAAAALDVEQNGGKVCVHPTCACRSAENVGVVKI